MTAEFANVYEDAARADSYARLEFPGTYYLAFRDMPAIIGEPEPGAAALDFGCGAGRSTRFLGGLGFDRVIGVDISEAMLAQARERDPAGDYRLIPDGDLSSLGDERFDCILCAFPFDNIADRAHKLRLFRGLAGLLAPGGSIINLVSSADLYLNEWTSFSSRQFEDNRAARPGDVVRLVMLDVADRRPVEDIFFPEDSYRDLYAAAALELIDTHRPVGREDEPFDWVSETRIAPWTICVLAQPAPAD